MFALLYAFELTGSFQTGQIAEKENRAIIVLKVRSVKKNEENFQVGRSTAYNRRNQIYLGLSCFQLKVSPIRCGG